MNNEIFRQDEKANKRKGEIIVALTDDYCDYLSELTLQEIEQIAESGVFLKKDVQ